MAHDREAIARALEDLTNGKKDPAEVTQDPATLRIAVEFRLAVANFENAKREMMRLRAELRRAEDSAMRLEGRVEACAHLLREIYTQSLEETDDDRDNEGDHGGDEASGVEMDRQPVHGAEG